MLQTISSDGEEALVGFEGEVLRAYQDSVGVWTIGVGHTASAGLPKPVKGMTITKAQSREILRRDLEKVFIPRVLKQLGNHTSQTAIDCSTSFDFNTGKINSASWVGKFKAGDMAGARANLMLWNKAGGRVLAGLTRRRSAEADILTKGIYPNGKGGKNTIPAPKAVLVAGDTDAELVTVQKNLKKIGIPIEPSGTYGPKTVDAVMKVQASHPNLTEDGVLGPATKAAIQREADMLDKTKKNTAVGGVATVAAAGTLPWWVPVLVIALMVAVIGYVLWSYRDEIKAKANRSKK
jgi:lysozyme